MTRTVPVRIDDPANAAVLALSDDRLPGFRLDPVGEIAERRGVERACCTTDDLDPEAMR